VLEHVIKIHIKNLNTLVVNKVNTLVLNLEPANKRSQINLMYILSMVELQDSLSVESHLNRIGAHPRPNRTYIYT